MILISILNLSVIFLITLIVFAYSFIAINNSYDKFKEDDPQEIVIDEFVGQILPLLFIPIYETLFLIPKFYYCIAAFIIFRIFDILKPFPINYVDNNVQGPLGIMLDDIIAGVYTISVLTIIFFFIGG